MWLARRWLILVAALVALALAPPSRVLGAGPRPDPKAIRLIVRGDDMGFSHSSNTAAVHCYKDGVMRTVEVLAVGPWFPEAARLLRENPGLDVGLHLALTSEWDNLKWRPLTRAPSLVGVGGWFHPMNRVRPHYGRSGALTAQPWKLAEIEAELRAQIELARREVPHLSHLSDHMVFTTIGEDVAALVGRLATEYGLDIDTRAHGVRTLQWNGPSTTPAQKVATFARILERLGPGTWLFVDHPAFDTPEMRAIHHVGYEDVAVDRQGVVEAWTSPKTKEIAARRGIQLIGYRDLAAR